MADAQGFTEGTARLVKAGAIDWDTSGEMTLTDIYAVTIPAPATPATSAAAALQPATAWRPLGYDLSYQYTDSGGTHTATKRKNVAGLPDRNSAHPLYSFMRCVNIRWNQPDNASRIWVCEAVYRYAPQTRENDDDPGDGGGSPVKVKFLDVEFYSHNVTVPLSYSTFGNPLCNGAGEPITPEPMIDIASPCLRIIARNQRAPSYYNGYMGSLNDDGMTICGLYFPRYCARLTFSSRETEVVVGGTEEAPVVTTMFEHTFNIEGNFTPSPRAGSPLQTYDGVPYAGWARIIPNTGYNYKDGSGNLVRAQVASASDPTLMVDSPIPVPLDSNGHISNSYSYYVVLPGPAKNWGRIGFPTSW